MQFTNDFSVEWYTIDEGLGGPLKLRVNLTRKNIDITQWTTTNGEWGYWLGIGFGTKVMAGADIVLCTFKYTNQDSDMFSCTDSFANYNSQPTPDT